MSGHPEYIDALVQKGALPTAARDQMNAKFMQGFQRENPDLLRFLSLQNPSPAPQASAPSMGTVPNLAQFANPAPVQFTGPLAGMGQQQMSDMAQQMLSRRMGLLGGR